MSQDPSMLGESIHAKRVPAPWLSKKLRLATVYVGNEDERLAHELFSAPNKGESGSGQLNENSTTILHLRCDETYLDPESPDLQENTRALRSQLRMELEGDAISNGEETRRVVVAIGSTAPLTLLALLSSSVDALILLAPTAAEHATRKSDHARHEGFARCFAEEAPLKALGELRSEVFLTWPAGGSKSVLRCAHAWRLALEESPAQLHCAVIAFSDDRIESNSAALDALRGEVGRFLTHIVSKT